MKCEETAILDNRQERFKEIYEKYCRLMKYIALKNLGDETLAEDAVQNAFIKVFRFIEKIEEIDSPKTRAFLVCITENCCKDISKIEYRQRIKQLKLFSEKGDKKQILDIDAIEEKEFVEQLDKLPEQLRTVLMLRFYYEMSFDEIGQVLGITNQNVRKRLWRTWLTKEATFICIKKLLRQTKPCGGNKFVAEVFYCISPIRQLLSLPVILMFKIFPVTVMSDFAFT